MYLPFNFPGVVYLVKITKQTAREH